MTATSTERVLEYLRSYSQAHGYMPNYAEIAKALGMVKSQVFYHVHKLEAEGKIELLPIGGRNIRVIERKP